LEGIYIKKVVGEGVVVTLVLVLGEEEEEQLVHHR
jgi:hypothetical protein